MGVPLAIIHFRLEISITHQLFWVSPFMEPPINGILGYIKTFFINIPIYIYIYIYSNIPLENIFQYIRLIKKQQHIIKMAYVILIYIYIKHSITVIYIYTSQYIVYIKHSINYICHLSITYTRKHIWYLEYIFSIYLEKNPILRKTTSISSFSWWFFHIFSLRGCGWWSRWGDRLTHRPVVLPAWWTTNGGKSQGMLFNELYPLVN